MKHAKLPKMPRQMTTASRKDSSVGDNGISIDPPAYGIDFLDCGHTPESPSSPPVQLHGDLEKVVLPQDNFTTNASPIQLHNGDESRENRTGMPDQLKAGLEQLGGVDLSGVQVHYNSAKPAQLNALAYAQGQEIHLGPRQERHLPHEGWHVVQQMQGRVKPTMQAQGAAINDSGALEGEADMMGTKASRWQEGVRSERRSPTAMPVENRASAPPARLTVQRVSNEEVATARRALKDDSAAAIERYVPNWKKTKTNGQKRQIFEDVARRENDWYRVRDHVMRGEAGTPPTGYHSKALETGVNAVGTGATNPPVATKAPYKQWIKRSGQTDNQDLKISTFFPDSWDENKIRANVLLSFTSAGHHMQDQLPLENLGGATWFPDKNIEDPPKPT